MLASLLMNTEYLHQEFIEFLRKDLKRLIPGVILITFSNNYSFSSTKHFY